ncbi:PF11453 family protein [Bordetella bronchiseptica E014]|nr:DUF2950 family protein [Bordetella bronchiseptica]KAK51794.1 PF11453 family protein [Bordetella bronchiseptica OSU054]KAK67773.1 PF11453 family protein [Bordetella bronchiseptica MO211]KAK79548.1 PF11453 family protein [Bordetella bronchiseptica CA90 BB02]KCV25525.1 PF11453 family protein [Bordetella bronchiseptica 00-P-2730]KCV41887.1 PF11453 family protein [Bordetella bronchiseptica 345]KCV57550.1 PF11453 family protein [Bordetella bronchiseptica 7E71]KDB74737.1 PF11453 family protein [
MHNKHPMVRRALGALALAWATAGAAMAQAPYPTAQAAGDALVDAIATSDDVALARVLGANYRQVFPAGDHTQAIYRFLAAWADRHDIQSEGDRRAWLAVGLSGWTFPVPMARGGQGQWRFDLQAGVAEMRRRTIGRNELAAIDGVRQLAQAQARYAQGPGQGRYASRLVSRPEHRDGLYWPAADQADAPPFGPDALAMGADTPLDQAYAGYRFRVEAAPDGKDFRVVAWPAQYRRSGVYTFAADASGQVLQRDLGGAGAVGMRTDLAGWQPVAQ